jgi:hypothetical protein
MMGKYFYKRTEHNLYTVGYEDSSGNWHSDSDWDSREKAQQQVAYLNGGNVEKPESVYQ